MDMSHHNHHMTMTGMNDMNMTGMTTEMDHGSHTDGMGGMDHGSHDMDMHGNSSMHTMIMYFHTGVSQYILFEPLLTKDVGGMVGACICMFFMAFLYEGMKVFRERMLQKSVADQRAASYGTSSSSKEVLFELSAGKKIFSLIHFIQTILHMIQVFISYCLMLVFMTYNVWLCISIILGAGAGYFTFGWMRMAVLDINEHCH